MSAFHPAEEPKKRKKKKLKKFTNPEETPSSKPDRKAPSKIVKTLGVPKRSKAKNAETSSSAAVDSRPKEPEEPESVSSKTVMDTPKPDQPHLQSPIRRRSRMRRNASSTTSTSDEEYKSMVKSGLIVKPKKQSLVEPQDFKPKTEAELLDYFLAKHSVTDFIPGARKTSQPKLQQTSEAPLTKRQVFRQHFGSQPNKGQDLKPSDFFPLNLNLEDLRVSEKKLRKKNKKKRKKKLKLKKTTQNDPKPSGRKKKSSENPKSKTRKKKLGKLVRKIKETEEIVDLLHDVTAICTETKNPKTPKKSKKNKKRLKNKKKPPVPSALLKLMESVPEFDPHATEVFDESPAIEIASLTEQPETKKLPSRNTKTKKPVMVPRGIKVYRTKQKRVPLLSQKPASRPLKESFSKIWVELSGPDPRMVDFTEDLNARIMKTLPGCNLSLNHFFPPQELQYGTYSSVIVSGNDVLAAEDRVIPGCHVFPLEVPGTRPRPQKQSQLQVSNAPAQHVPTPDAAMALSWANAEKKRLKLKGRKRRSTSPEKEFKEATTEAETQLKTLEVTTSIQEVPETPPKPVPSKTEPAPAGKHVTFQGSFDIDECLLQQTQSQIPQKASPTDEDFDYDTLRSLQAQLKEGIRIILTKGAVADIHVQLEALRKELARKKGGDPPDSLGLPRVYDKSLVRYELPMDIKLLEGITPLMYLETYSFVGESLKNLHAKVYKRHRDLQPTGKFSFRALTVAMQEIVSQDWSPDDSEAVCRMLGVTLPKPGQKSDLLTLANIPGSGGATPAGTASEISKLSSPSQQSGLKEPSKTASSRQSSSSSIGHQSQPSPPASPGPDSGPSKLIDLLNIGKKRDWRTKLGVGAVPDIAAFKASKLPVETPQVSNTLDLHQFQVVAAFGKIE
ncbi:unnamed protein product [Notodromas monacha]|uniref:Uncharacterized protein n=1 Tax=Notodromas monacha TaxID=399045 RepID=A0A7R9GBH3_9CRUS|nr:unnamed protein product [Notodromas monacha]CAG0916516.1 unnamed protein product [Notodromas monacha]